MLDIKVGDYIEEIQRKITPEILERRYFNFTPEHLFFLLKLDRDVEMVVS